MSSVLRASISFALENDVLTVLTKPVRRVLIPPISLVQAVFITANKPAKSKALGIRLTITARP